MATTLKEIAQHLDKRNWKYKVDEAKSRLITGVKADNIENFVIIFQLLREGRSVQIYIPQLLKVKDSVYKGVLFQSILSFHWSYPTIRFEYDRLDGEIRATVDLLLEDAPLTYEQCDRALTTLIELVDTHLMPRMQAILATGIDPGRKVLATKILDQMPADMVDLLAEAIRDHTQPNN
ncbi:MAG: YbjN domain-containing protein [Cyanobacteria bacterium P01_E01_bin.35]